MADKTRFSARVKERTLDTIDSYSESTGLNRSSAIDQMVEEWAEGGDDPNDQAYATLSAAGGTLWSAFVVLALMFVFATGGVTAGVDQLASLSTATLQMMGLVFSLLAGVAVERGRRLVRDYGVRRRDVLRLYVTHYLGLPEPDLDVPQDVMRV